MSFYISIESMSGTLYGEIHSVSQWTTTIPLDKAGTISFTMPASDRARGVIINSKRVANCYAYIDKVKTLIGSGIIENYTVDLDPQGNPTGTYTFYGIDRLRELSWTTVGGLLLSATTAGPSTLIAYNGTWSLDAVNGYTASAKTITYQFAYETVLDAFIKLADITGEHFRAGVGRELVWLQNSQPSSGIRAFYGIDPIATEIVANNCIITSLSMTRDSMDVYLNKLYAIGAGSGGSLVTLDGATLPGAYTTAGYQIASDAKGHYLENTNVTFLPAIERVMIWKDQTTPNGLMEMAYETLRRAQAPQESYRITLAGLKTVLYPGQTLRVVAHQYVDGYHTINIDADLVILEVQNKLDNMGLRTVGLTCSNIDRFAADDTTAMVNQLAQSINTFTR